QDKNRRPANRRGEERYGEAFAEGPRCGRTVDQRGEEPGAERKPQEQTKPIRAQERGGERDKRHDEGDDEPDRQRRRAELAFHLPPTPEGRGIVRGPRLRRRRR